MTTTTTRHLSDIGPLELARKALELTEASPDFRYERPGDGESCVYVHEGQGSCLFGQALVELGVDPAELERVNILGIEALIDSDESNAFETAQGMQDVGVAWGDENIQGALLTYIEAHS